MGEGAGPVLSSNDETGCGVVFGDAEVGSCSHDAGRDCFLPEN